MSSDHTMPSSPPARTLQGAALYYIELDDFNPDLPDASWRGLSVVRNRTRRSRSALEVLGDAALLVSVKHCVDKVGFDLFGKRLSNYERTVRLHSLYPCVDTHHRDILFISQLLTFWCRM